MKIRIPAIGLFLLGLCLATPTAAQDPVRIWLPEIAAGPGDELVIGLQVGDITGLNVSSCDLLITYDARIVTALGIIQVGTMTNRWSQAYRVGFKEESADSIGLIDIALATADRIPSGSGTFVNITFSVSDSARDGQISPLTIEEAILNNRNPETAPVNGKITVVSGLIGDFNGDCIVDFKDFLGFVQHYGTEEGDEDWDPVYDLTGDGRVDFRDFVVFIQHYGDEC